MNLMHGCARCIPPGQVKISESEILSSHEQHLEKIRPLLDPNIGQVSRLFKRGKRGPQRHRKTHTSREVEELD